MRYIYNIKKLIYFLSLSLYNTRNLIEKKKILYKKHTSNPFGNFMYKIKPYHFR